MNKTYIVYRIIDDSVELYRSHKGWWSGLVLKEPHPSVLEVGVANVFNEDSDVTKAPVEQYVFGVYTTEERIPFFPHLESPPPVLFETKTVSQFHLGAVQNSVLPLVLGRNRFAAQIVFLKNSRNIIKEFSIVPHAPE